MNKIGERARSKSRRMGRFLLHSMMWLCLTFLVILGSLIVIYWQTDWLESAAAGYLNDLLAGKGKVTYTRIEGGILNRITIHSLNLEMRDSFSIYSNRIELRYEIWPLLFNEIDISAIHVDKVDLELQSGSDSVSADTAGAHPFMDRFVTLLKKESALRPVLSKLPKIKIDDIQLQVGALKIRSRPVTINNIKLHLNRFTADSSGAAINCEQLSGSWQERGLNLDRLSFTAKAGNDFANISQFICRVADSEFRLGANLATGRHNSVNLEIFESKIAGKGWIDAGFLPPTYPGDVTLTASLTGNASELAVSGQITGTFKHHRIERLEFAGGYGRQGYYVSHCLARADGAALDFDGNWLSGRSLKGKLDVSRLNLGSWSDGKIPAVLTGSLVVDASSIKRKKLTGQGRLHLVQSQIYDIPVDSLLLVMQAEQGMIKMLPSSYLQLKDSVKFIFDGQLDSDWNSDLIVSAFDLDLGQLSTVTPIPHILGKLDAHFRMYGPMTDPSISGLFSMPWFRQDSLTLDSIRFDMFAERVMSRRKGTANFRIHSGMYNGFAMNDMVFKAEFEKDTLHIPEISLHNGENQLQAGLTIRRLSKEIDIDFNRFHMQYQDYWLKNDGEISFIIDSAYISLESFSLRGPASSALEIMGFVDRQNDDAQLFLNLRDVETDQFNQFWDDEPKVAGVVNGTAELIDPLHDPNLEIDLSLKDFRYNDNELGYVEAEFKYADSSISVQRFEYDDGPAHLDFSGNLNLDLSGEQADIYEQMRETALDFRLNWKQINLNKIARVLRLKKRLSGIASGYFELGGRASSPVIRHHLQLDQFRYGTYRVDNLSAFAQYNSGYLTLDSLGATIDGTRLHANGWLQYSLSLDHPDTNMTDNPFEAYLSFQEDTLTFLSHFNEQMERITGDISSELYLGGTLGKPGLDEGFIRVADGELLLSRVKDPIRKVNIDLQVSDSIMTVKKFTGYSDKQGNLLDRFGRYLGAVIPGSGSGLEDGLLEVQGQINLRNLLRPQVDLSLNLENFYIDYFIENTRIKLRTDNLKIAGRDTILITGDLTLPEGVYQVDVKQMEKNALLASKKVSKAPPYIAMELDLQLPGNFIVTSSPLDLTNNFKINLSGDLQVQQDAGFDLMKISGLLEVPSGEYAAFNQQFNIQSGSIHFKDPTRMNPELNIVATKQVGSRVFELTISGELEKWRQDIRVLENGRELPLNEADKLTLLTLGVDVGQVQANADSTFRNIGEEVLTTAVLTALERSAEKYTGLDKIKIQTDDSFVDLRRGRLNNGLEDATVSLGKFLTNDLYVEYQTRFGGKVPTPQLSWDAGNRLGLKYRLNKFWSFDSQYEKTNQGNNKIRIGISWEYSF